jgi:hypothetical protein
MRNHLFNSALSVTRQNSPYAELGIRVTDALSGMPRRLGRRGVSSAGLFMSRLTKPNQLINRVRFAAINPKPLTNLRSLKQTLLPLPYHRKRASTGHADRWRSRSPSTSSTTSGGCPYGSWPRLRLDTWLLPYRRWRQLGMGTRSLRHSATTHAVWVGGGWVRHGRRLRLGRRTLALILCSSDLRLELQLGLITTAGGVVVG